MSDKPKSIHISREQIDRINENGFETCVGYNLNAFSFKECDGDNSSVASTVGDSFNNCYLNDVDEWFAERCDAASRINVYTVNENELEEDSTPQTTDEISTSDIEGYCFIDNFGQLHTIGLVTKNINGEFQSIGEVLRANNYGETNTLQCPSQTITLHSDEVCRPNTSHEQNIANLQPEIVDEVRCILKEEFVSNGNNLTTFNLNPKLGKTNKSHDVINCNVSDSDIVNISNEVDTGDIQIVKVPKKYVISGKIITENILELESSRNKFSKSVVGTAHNLINNNGRFLKGRSILKCRENEKKSSPLNQGNEVQNSDIAKQTHGHCRPTSINLTRPTLTAQVNNDGSNLDHNISLKKPNTPLAVVEISTNKSDDTTEIVIKTEDGENVFKGKTSEMMKAEKIYYTSDSHCDPNLKIDDNMTTSDDDHINNALKSIGIDQNSYEKFENPSNLSVMYGCPVKGCTTMYDKIHSMNIHILCHYNIRPFKCDYAGCSWSFHSNFRLKRHKITHLKTKNFKCTYNSCERTFTTIYNLRTHLKLHQRPAVLKCTVEGCKETFQTKRTLEVHLKSHGENHAPYVCKIDGCGKCYYSSNSYISHTRKHRHSLDELRCDYCYKVFDKPCRLKSHLRVHTGAKPYKCTFEGCDWAFMTSSKLRRHEHKHTQVRKFQCDLCMKQFLRGEHLKDHLTKHFVCKSFPCPVQDCGLNFKNRSSLYAHVKKRHPGMSISISPTISDSWPIPQVKSSSLTEIIGHIQNSDQTDTSSLDAIEMLSNDNLISMESLQYNSEDITRAAAGAQSVNFNGISPESLLVGIPELSYNSQLEQDFNTDITNSSLVTHIVVTESEEDEDETSGFDCNTDSTDINVGSIGSARTGLTYQETLQDRERRKNQDDRQSQSVRKCLSTLSSNDETKVPSTLESHIKEPLGPRVASDVVLSAGLLGGSQDNLTGSLLLQDELSSGDLYVGTQVQEEASLELLCEDSVPRHSDFEQSTINLRDLE